MPPGELPGRDPPLEVWRLSESLTTYRIVKTDRPYDPALLDSFKSNYELRRKPRRAEISFTPMHMGISVYLRPERAHATARAFPMIGEYVARVELEPEMGVAFALTAEPGHLTLWARPLQTIRGVVDIVEVGD